MIMIIAQSAAGRLQAKADAGRTINTRANLECDRSATLDRLMTQLANRESMVLGNRNVNRHRLHNRALVLVDDRYDAIKRAIRNGLPVPPARNQFEFIADEVCHLDQALAELKAEQNTRCHCLTGYSPMTSTQQSSNMIAQDCIFQPRNSDWNCTGVIV